MILTPLQKNPKKTGDLDKLIVPKGFKKLPKVQNIAQSGHNVSKVIFSAASSPMFCHFFDAQRSRL